MAAPRNGGPTPRRAVKIRLGVYYSVCLSVCLSVKLVHSAKTVGQNEMPFDRDTRVVPSNSALEKGPRLRGDLRGRNPQLAAMPPNAKLFWPLCVTATQYGPNSTARTPATESVGGEFVVQQVVELL